MALLANIIDKLFHRQKWVEAVIIFLFCSLIAFRFNDEKIDLVWNDYPFIALVLAFLIACIAFIWIKIEKQKTQLLINDLKSKTLAQEKSYGKKIDQLSLRQKEVFELIVSGKSNKEIMATLNIELSTLKSHINQIYKILDIKTRKDARLFESDN